MILITWDEEYKKAGPPQLLLSGRTSLDTGEKESLELVGQMHFTHCNGIAPK